MEKVSIVIPCYNQGHFLSDAIESALNQTYPDIEVIVVDDGSTDDTKIVANKYPQVRYIYQNNKHLSGARNTGIKSSKGKWIVTLDSDDKIHPTFVEKCLNEVELKGVDIVSTWLQTFGKENRRWGSVDIDPVWQNFIQRNHINCCSLFSREMWSNLGGYDENMKQGFEDWDFWRRATKRGYKVRIVTDYLFFYRKHGVSMFAEAQKKRQELIDFMRKKESETGELIDIVYPLGSGSLYGNSELKFSIRSVEKHLTGWRNIVIVGVFPAWGNSNLKIIPAKDSSAKALNILEKIRLACLHPDITDKFLFMNDDHVFINDCDAVTYPYYYSQEDFTEIMNNRNERDPYKMICNDTIRTFDGLRYFDIHKPMVIDKKVFLAMLEDINFKKYGYGLLIKSSYCRYDGITGVQKRDCILRNSQDSERLDDILSGQELFSFHDEAVTRELIGYLDKNFPIKSQFEV